MIAAILLPLLLQAVTQESPVAVQQAKIGNAGSRVWISGDQSHVVLHQVTTEWCSPVIANVVGNVTVNCKGVDPRAVQVLNQQLSQMKLDLESTRQVANAWADDYHKLEQRLVAAGVDSKLSRQAQQYLHQGKLEQARAILRRILGPEDKQTDQTAANHYNLGLASKLLFREQEALPDLRKAYKLAEVNERPAEEVAYGEEYGEVLLRQNNFEEAEPVLLAVVKEARQLAKTSPSYQSDLARAVNLLGILFYRTERMKQAEHACQEALDNFQKVAKTQPDTYKTNVAIAYMNLANVFRATQRATEAEKANLDALAIYAYLAKGGAADTQPNVAGVLNNLGALYASDGRAKEAERAYIRALNIRRPLAQANPAAYERDLANTLLNLGNLYLDAQIWKPAQDKLTESLGIRRRLVAANPHANQAELAGTLELLGRFYDQLRLVQPADEARLAKQAEDAYLEARHIRRRLAQENSPAYDMANLVGSIDKLATFYAETNRPKEAQDAYKEAVEVAKLNPAAQAVAAKELSNFAVFCSTNCPEEAEAKYLEALQIFQQLAKTDSAAHQPYIALVMDNLEIFYFAQGRVKDAGTAYQQELEVRRGLAKANPTAYQRGLVETLQKVALFDAMTKGRNVPRARQEIEEAIAITRENWKADPAAGDPFASSLIAAAQIELFTDERPAIICSLGREAASVANSPALKQHAEGLADGACGTK